MSASVHGYSLAALISLGFLTGCASTQPVPYTGVTSSPQMKPDTQDDSGHIAYSYNTPTDWNKYSRAILDPVVIYQGKDAQFDDVTAEQKQQLAAYMQQQFGKRVGGRFPLTNAITPGTLRIRLTLTGAQTTTAFLGTFTRFDLMGGPYNIVQSVRGKQGSFTGSVSYAVEIYDAPSNQLLKAYIAKQYPNSLNIGATWGALSAAETGLDKGAEQLQAQLK
ncbi:DUF3313 domain-containing protein (plasmid) [Rahnella aceris]|uniref:DUF3313 domain-containing protein n=1 Tax=Rahnella sp. (strain Y9602) TaxID=2703885 RepID=UPI0019069F8E|nr:DUF3313 domain-containing protein [Rahnella aceris]QQN37609.1 DUF3313 domain-containing protein [Rahnella aceris]